MIKEIIYIVVGSSGAKLNNIHRPNLPEHTQSIPKGQNHINFKSIHNLLT